MEEYVPLAPAANTLTSHAPLPQRLGETIVVRLKHRRCVTQVTALCYNPYRLQTRSKTEEPSATCRYTYLARFLDRSLETYHIVVLPHLRDEGLARRYCADKPSLDVFEWSKGRHGMLGNNAEGAEAVQDWGLKTGYSADGGVDMQRVPVSVQSIQGCLVH